MKAMAGRMFAPRGKLMWNTHRLYGRKKLKMQALKLEVSVKAKNLPGHVLSEQTNNDLRVGYGGKLSRGLTQVYNTLCFKHGVINSYTHCVKLWL
jgi:hypothetical protein